MRLDGRKGSIAALAWRGWGVAAALAVLVHWVALSLVDGQFTLSFQPVAQSARLVTRMVEPAAAPLQPKQISEITPAQTPKPKPLQSSSVSPRAPQKNESKQPLGQIVNAQSAIENVAKSPQLSQSPPASVVAERTPVPNGAPALTGAAPAAPSGSSLAVNLGLPASNRLEYVVLSKNGSRELRGASALQWSTDGASYTIRWETYGDPELARLEQSEGRVTELGLAPVRFGSSRGGRSEQATHFRSELGKIQFSNNKPESPLLPGAQDQLSVWLQLGGIIGGAPERYAGEGRIQIQVAGLDSAELLDFQVYGLTEIQLPEGKMQAIKISRDPRHEFDPLLELWLAPQSGYLPVRVRSSATSAPEQIFTEWTLFNPPRPVP
jgi:hypothetical protein